MINPIVTHISITSLICVYIKNTTKKICKKVFNLPIQDGEIRLFFVLSLPINYPKATETIIRSLINMIKNNHKGSMPIHNKDINVDIRRNLSANGSIIEPNCVCIENFLAIQPSRISVIPAKQNKINAK